MEVNNVIPSIPCVCLMLRIIYQYHSSSLFCAAGSLLFTVVCHFLFLNRSSLCHKCLHAFTSARDEKKRGEKKIECQRQKTVDSIGSCPVFLLIAFYTTTRYWLQPIFAFDCKGFFYYFFYFCFYIVSPANRLGNESKTMNFSSWTKQNDSLGTPKI